jgi:C4-dicarboxylate transporter DctQ subunit
MTLVTFGQVVARYVFNYSFVWAVELTGVMFGALIFIGMAYGVRVGSHIGIDAFVKSLSRPAARRVVAMVATLLCIVYALIVLVGGWQYVRKMYEVGIEMQDMPVAAMDPARGAAAGLRAAGAALRRGAVAPGARAGRAPAR